MKNRSLKSRKIDIFPKGLTHGFFQKWLCFQFYIYQAIQARKTSFMIFGNIETLFEAIKTRSSKSRKIDIFSKGLTHGFCPKMACFSTVFFQAIQARKMSLTKFQKEKTLFQAMKKRSSKSRKIDIFPKGLTHGFFPKMAIFPTFFFRQCRLGNCLLGYWRDKKRLCRL